MVDRSVLVRLRADVSDYQRKFAAAGATTALFVKNLDSADSRMGNLVQTALALAPALVPIGATAVPALAGLTAQAGFAAAGVGVLVAAFNGVGDSLKALNEYQLEPTAENYAKLREEMRKLPEEGRDFVRFLDGDVMPALDRLQDVAAAGALPGFEDGIDDLMGRLPEIRNMVDGLADAAGQLAEETGKGLSSDEFDDFFRFLEAEAEPTLLNFGRTVGNVLDGLATTLIGLNPLANDFEDALLDWSRGFADIEPEDFADFVAYVRDVGPDAVDALSAVGGAIVALVEAAAPVGAVTLPVIEALANVITAIANSSAGPALIGAAAGVAAISRAVALYNAANGSALLGLMRTAGTDGDKGARGLTGFGKAAAGLAGVLVAVEVIKALQRAADESLPGVQRLTSRLIELEEMGSRGFSVSLGQEFDSLGDSIDRITDPSRLQRLDDTVLPDWLNSSTVREGKAEIELLDEALAGLVATGGADAGESVLTQMVEQGYLTEEQLGRLRGELTQYDEALATAANQERLAADGADAFGDSAEDAASKVRTFKESLDRLNALLDGRANMRDYEAAIDDFAAAMKRNGNTFDINTEKGRENQAMLDGVVGSTLAVAEGMKGAARQRFLTAAISDLREMGDKLNVPRGQLRDLIRELQEANRQKVNPKVDADTREAMAKVAALRNSIEALRDRSVTITTVYDVVRNASDALPYRGQADGGTIPGQRQPYGDKMLYLLAPGEEVISNRRGQADRHRPLLKAINGGLADGGTAGRRKAQGGAFTPEETEAERRRREKREAEAEQRERDREKREDNERTLEERRRDREARAQEALIEGQEAAAQQLIDAAQAQLDAAEQVRDQWAQAMERVGAAATAGFESDLFGSQQHGLWSGAGGASGSSWRDALLGDIGGLEARGGLITRLAGAGVTGAALEALLGQADNSQISAMLDSGEVGEFASLFARRETLLAAVGQQAGQAAYGTQYAAAVAAVGALGAQVLMLQQQLAIISGQRGITVYEAISAQATAAEIARLTSMVGAA